MLHVSSDQYIQKLANSNPDIRGKLRRIVLQCGIVILLTRVTICYPSREPSWPWKRPWRSDYCFQDGARQCLYACHSPSWMLHHCHDNPQLHLERLYCPERQQLHFIWLCCLIKDFELAVIHAEDSLQFNFPQSQPLWQLIAFSTQLFLGHRRRATYLCWTSSMLVYIF